MGFGAAIKSVMSQYVVFSGRARRSEYWYFTLFSYVAVIAAIVVGGLLNFNALGLLVVLALIAPTFAVTTRRMHDAGHSGWWQLISIVSFIFSFQDSKGDNEYGPSPKAVGSSFGTPVGS